MFRLLAAALLIVASAAAEQVPIVVSPKATQVERTAASELASHLAAEYPPDSFPITTAEPRVGKAILLGTASRYVPSSRLSGPESFVVTHVTRNDAPLGVIAGADPRGVLFAVYALLEKLGWGFYLSYEAAPSPQRASFSFDRWTLSDAPVFADRVVFEWHNFLSSASTWEIGDWQRWIRGAAGMRFNTVMVHAYGNNPMFTFRHNGQVKPVGYLATTQKGRDWGTEHVNDVRRLWGGEVFTGPVFGGSAALVPEAERAPAAQKLTRSAFAFARSYGLHVTFALDVDTESANPQNIVLTLPPSARFASGTFQLANPDSPEGYAYWKAQVAQLLEAYPQIDRLVVWFRPTNTPWRSVKREEFPAAWQPQYDQALRDHPALSQDRNAPSMFALGRVAAAFSRALSEIGRRDVELGAGTWNATHLAAAQIFFPPGVKFYWLDYGNTFDKPETQTILRAIPRERPMLPIVWAHHDDRAFIGRPYTPFARFTSLVEGAGTGFGIIHWTLRPLDLYFKSLGEQVWRETRDRPLKDTAHDMAVRSFGSTAADAGGDYLFKWITEGRMFGRETGDRFIDVRLSDASEVMARCRERIALLNAIHTTALSAGGRERLQYYRDYEEFTAAFFRVHSAFEHAQDLFKKQRIQEAQAAIAGADPAAVIEQYVKASTHGGITRGEQALVVALNLKWLPYILSLRQALGLEPARFRFAPTQHEPLAQGAGRNTFWIDDRHQLWKVLGDKETGGAAILKLGGIMGDRLAPGRYRVTLTFDGAPDRDSEYDVRTGFVELTAPLVARTAVITPQ